MPDTTQAEDELVSKIEEYFPYMGRRLDSTVTVKIEDLAKFIQAYYRPVSEIEAAISDANGKFAGMNSVYYTCDEIRTKLNLKEEDR